ncbi:alpha/beta hydrolase [uncultured Actinomyces sp.]|uniref:alpha/beta hydrolase n=1 Tax=uncultured Actinomyces sp. TaxID=249061 RepID=UPI0028D3C425|nr:alpha/beta hydrolase [uncultured Actinomyces sp.]
MRPTPLTARKAGAALAVLMLSTALAACQPDGSTDAAPSTTATASTESTDQTSAPTNGSTTTPTDGSSDGSGSSIGTAATTAAPTSTDQTSTPSDGSTSNPTGGSQGDAPRGLESFYSQDIDWKDCSNETTTFQCGTVTVPVDYEHPDGKTITIAVKKLPALDGDAEHGSLFLNPGGPGGSGIEVVEAKASVFEELRGSYDIIGFDPRGLGQSTPITCWSDEELNQHLTDTKNGKSSTLSEIMATDAVFSKNPSVQERIDRGASNAARCAKYSQVPELLDHVGTRDVARDLDVLRATNGNAKLNYLGISYGTYIGALYADLFPGRVGRTVLDSAVDPSKRLGGELRAGQVAFSEGVLRQYVEHCQAQSACPLTGSTDEAITQLAAFVNGLDKNPLTTPDSDATVNTQEATDIILQLAVRRPDWDGLTAMLTPAMTNHDGTLMAKAKQGSPGLSPEMTAEEAARSANAMVLGNAVVCNDNPDTGSTASEMDAQAAAERKAHPFFGGTSNAAEAYCRGWGHRGTTPPQETRAEGSAPILVVGITGDAQTLYSWSRSLAGQLDNGHLLTVEGYGHGAFDRNSCATTAITGFLVNGTMPDEGTTCAADPQPAEG